MAKEDEEKEEKGWSDMTPEERREARAKAREERMGGMQERHQAILDRINERRAELGLDPIGVSGYVPLEPRGSWPLHGNPFDRPLGSKWGRPTRGGK